VKLLSQALDWFAARSLLDLIVRFVALVNEQTKQRNIANKVQPADNIFNHRNNLPIIRFRRGSLRYFAFALRQVSDSLPLVASRSAFYHPLVEQRFRSTILEMEHQAGGYAHIVLRSL